MTAQALTVVENPARKEPLLAGARPAAIVPQSMGEAYRIAEAVCAAGMAPKGLDEPAKALVAIMHGLEVGLTPMAALQRIAVVNGRPTIWGDGAIGLVRGSGACEFIHESISGEGDQMVAKCEAKRKGEAKSIVGEFSVKDARVAGLWDKAGPWKQYPKRMLQMRARAFALRDGFADVLGGLYLREEIEDNEPRREPPPPPTVDPPLPPAAKRVPRLPPAPPPPPPPKAASASPSAPQEAFDFDAFAESFRNELKSVGHTLDESNSVYTRLIANDRRLTAEQIEECDGILREHCAPFWTEDAP